MVYEQFSALGVRRLKLSLLRAGGLPQTPTCTIGVRIFVFGAPSSDKAKEHSLNSVWRLKNGTRTENYPEAWGLGAWYQIFLIIVEIFNERTGYPK